MRVQTNTLLRYKVFYQNMYKIRLPSVFSPVSRPIVTNLRSSVNTRCVRESNRMRCSAIQNAKRKERNPWELTLISRFLPLCRCLPRMWSLAVQWRICHFTCTLGLQNITCRCCRSSSPRLLTAFLLPQNPPLKHLLRRSVAFIGERLQTLVFPRTQHCITKVTK